MPRPRVLQTVQARAYAAGGILLLGAGAVLGSQLLNLAGGILIVWIILEGALVSASVPRASLELDATRLQEAGETEARVVLERARPDHQFELALDPSLEVTESSNIFTVPRRGRHVHRLRVRAHVRGPRALGPLRIRTWSPSRLVVAETSDQAAAQLEVVPRALQASEVGMASRVLKPSQGRFSINRPGQGFEFFSLRPYQSSDTIRDVNWKASARLDDLIVNQRLRETQTEVLFLLDARLPSGVGPPGASPLDRSCRALLALFDEAVRARDVVRAYDYGAGVRDIVSHHQDKVHELESHLARLPADGMSSLREAWITARPSMRSAGPILVFSSLEGDETAPAAIAEMVARGHGVTVISPRPTGPTWDHPAAKRRRERRDSILAKVQGMGASLADWAPDAPLAVHKPTLQSGVAAR